MKRPKRSSGVPPSAHPGGAPVTPMRMGRFLLWFAVSLAVLFGLLLAPFSKPAVDAFTGSLVAVSAVLIRLFGGHAVALGVLLENPSTHFQIQMAYGCNGAHVTVLLWAAVLAFPSPWLLKMKGLAAGTLAIHSVNLVRFISLFYIGQYSQAWFDFAHLYLWEGLMMLDTLVIFWLWAHLVRRAGSMADASAR